jgi:branched-chain amino acid aminotransferase
MSDQVRAWPGGTGGFKLGLNYAPGFVAQRAAAALGYQQLLWLLGETVAEAGAMNVFAVFERPDGGESHLPCTPSPSPSPARLSI